MLLSEVPHEPRLVQLGVAQTAIYRYEDGDYASICDVVTAPNQYAMKPVDPASPEYKDMEEFVADILRFTPPPVAHRAKFFTTKGYRHHPGLNEKQQLVLGNVTFWYD
jgi:hypothetical protein